MRARILSFSTYWILLFCFSILVSGCSSNQPKPSPKKQIIKKSVVSKIPKTRLDLQLEELTKKLELAPNNLDLHYQKAKVFLKKGEKQVALDYLSDLVEKQPKQAKFYALRGKLLLETGYNLSAWEDLIFSYKNKYHTKDVFLGLAKLAKSQQDWKKMLGFLGLASKSDPKDSNILYKKALLEFQLNFYDLAEKSIKKAVALNSKSIKYYRLQFEVLSLLRKDKNAKKVLEIVQTKFSPQPWVYLNLSRIYLRKGAIEPAKKILIEGIQKLPKVGLLYYQFADIFHVEKNYKQSLKLFFQGLQFQPKSLWANLQIAKIYAKQKQLKKGIPFLIRAMQLGSRNRYVFHTLATYYTERDETYKAESIILRGLMINSNDVVLLVEYGVILERRGQFHEAILAFTDALKNRPGNYFIHGKLGTLYRAVKNYKKATLHFTLALAKNSRATRIRGAFIDTLVGLKHWKEAKEQLKVMLSQEPKNYWALAQMAIVEQNLKNYSYALAYINKAIVLQPYLASLKEIEGKILVGLKQYGLAEKSLQAALKMKPKSISLLTQLAYLKSFLGEPKQKIIALLKQAILLEEPNLSILELYLHYSKQYQNRWELTSINEKKAYQFLVTRKFTKAKQRIQKIKTKNRYFFQYLWQIVNLEPAKLSLTKFKNSKLTSWQWFYLGSEASDLKKFTLAENFFQKALAKEPKNSWIHLKLAYVYEKRNLNKKALALLEQFNQSFPNHIWAEQRLAINYDLTKQFVKAEKIYLKTLKFRPNSEIALNNLAWLYLTTKNLKLRKTKAALELSKKAVKINPTSANLDTLAEAYFQTKDYENAIITIGKALDRVRGGNGDYFKKQKKKFEEALKKK
ncbi:MAG: tetratricopeptide (TPR) repeat protein [bacterium]|jgi:tetratricopeptide (TPR) repeat protein